jgi:hypothetical protein
MENSDKTWNDIIAGDVQKSTTTTNAFRLGWACFYHEKGGCVLF